jgi:hypothetical protein
MPWSGAPDSVRCTRKFHSELATFGNSGSRSAIIHRTVRCASRATATSRQRLSAKDIKCATVRAEVRARARRLTEQSTGPVRCTTGPSGGPEDRSSNGRTLTVGVTWLAHRTVSGAPCDSSLHQRLLWWLGL